MQSNYWTPMKKVMEVLRTISVRTEAQLQKKLKYFRVFHVMSWKKREKDGAFG